MTVELRPWMIDDAAALLPLYRDNPDLKTQFGGAAPGTLEEAREYIALRLPFTGPARNWAVVVDGAAVGNVGLTGIEHVHNTAWAHYWLGAQARGHGHAVRALATVTTWAFDEGLFRLELGHRVNNPASCRVAAGAGFLAEGVERQKLRYGAERFDVETHARLRTDPHPAVDLFALTG